MRIKCIENRLGIAPDGAIVEGQDDFAILEKIEVFVLTTPQARPPGCIDFNDPRQANGIGPVIATRRQRQGHGVGVSRLAHSSGCLAGSDTT